MKIFRGLSNFVGFLFNSFYSTADTATVWLLFLLFHSPFSLFVPNSIRSSDKYFKKKHAKQKRQQRKNSLQMCQLTMAACDSKGKERKTALKFQTAFQLTMHSERQCNRMEILLFRFGFFAIIHTNITMDVSVAILFSFSRVCNFT